MFPITLVLIIHVVAISVKMVQIPLANRHKIQKCFIYICTQTEAQTSYVYMYNTIGPVKKQGHRHGRCPCFRGMTRNIMQTCTYNSTVCAYMHITRLGNWPGWQKFWDVINRRVQPTGYLRHTFSWILLCIDCVNLGLHDESITLRGYFEQLEEQ